MPVIPKSAIRPNTLARIAGRYWRAGRIHPTEGPEWVECDRAGRLKETRERARWFYGTMVEVVEPTEEE